MSPTTPRSKSQAEVAKKPSKSWAVGDKGGQKKQSGSPHGGPPLVAQPSSERKIYLERIHDQNSEFGNNAISTSKYTLISFIPICIFEQFRRVANLFYLLISVLSCFHALWPFGPWVQVLPLLFVLAVSTLKEGFEYHARMKADKRTNESITYRLTVEGLLEELLWQDVRVGDILQLRNRDLVPADLILLCSSTDGGSCFVDTAQLDGEANLKMRQPLNVTSWIKDGAITNSLQGFVTVEPPNVRLTDPLRGHLELKDQERLPLSKAQFLMRGCSIRNTTWVVGLVVYTGHDTKIFQVGARSSRSDGPLARHSVAL